MSCMEAALQYAADGYYVFPVHRLGTRSKRPATEHGHKDATRDPDKIREWWKNSSHGIAIATGSSGLTAWDLDPAGATWIQENPDILDDLMQGVIAQTPRGGNHYLFSGRMPATVPGALADGVDIKSDGGYIVVAPTELSNGTYQWVSEDKLPPVSELPKLPQSLARLGKVAAGKRQEMPRLKDGGQLTKGQRNAGLYMLCVDLIRAGVLPAELEGVAQAVNLHRCDPPLTHEEVRGRVQSALRSKAVSAAQVDISGLLHRRFVRMSKIDPQPVPWLWPGRFAIGACHLLVGMPGCGKSTFLCWLAARITAGGDLPDGEQIQHHGSVLYLTSEDPLDYSLAPRLDAAGADRSKVFAVHKVLSLPRDLSDVGRLVASEDIKAIFVDPITSFLSGEHNDNQAVRSGLDEMGSFAREHGLTWIMVSHNSKAERKGMYSALGAVAFSAFCRGVQMFERKRDHWVIEDGKNSLAPAAPTLCYDLVENRLNWLKDTTPNFDAMHVPTYQEAMHQAMTEGLTDEHLIKCRVEQLLNKEISQGSWRAAKSKFKRARDVNIDTVVWSL